jgi:hypothetical protein
MKNLDLFRLKEGLNDVSNLKGVKFAYVVLKNKKYIDEEIESLQKSIEMSVDFQEFDRMRINLCEQHSEKNTDGSPVIINNAYNILDKKTFEDDVLKLKNKFVEAVSERDNQLREYDKLLKDDCTIFDKLVKIKIEYIPDDISSNQLENIKEIIED